MEVLGGQRETERERVISVRSGNKGESAMAVCGESVYIYLSGEMAGEREC